MKSYGWGIALGLWAFACNQSGSDQEPVVVSAPAPVVDSAQLLVSRYEQQLALADKDIDKSIGQLNRLSRQLQDSIEGTAVPPQIQEETINNYRNTLYEVQQVQSDLRNWRAKSHQAPDSLDVQAKKHYLEGELEQLEALLTKSRHIRQEAQTTMQESDREEY